MSELLLLDLFSGIGGFSLAAEWTGRITTIGFSEIAPFQSAVLKNNFPDIPNYGDIRNIKNVRADIVSGGFPCQPFSLAGKRRGKADDRHLWPEMLRVIGQAEAEWVLAENVPGIITMELDPVLSDLENIGYSCWTFEIPACAVDSDQLRNRVWILAHNRSKRREGVVGQTLQGQPSLPRCENVRGSPDSVQRPDLHTPKLCRSPNGVSKRLDALGNSIVPQVAYRFFKAMTDFQ